MGFLPSNASVSSNVRMHLMDTDEAYRGKARQELHKNVTSCIEQILEATTSTEQQLYGYLPPLSNTISNKPPR